MTLRKTVLLGSAYFLIGPTLCFGKPTSAIELEAVPDRAAAIVKQMTLEEKARQLQNEAPAIPRLDLPAYDWWNEGLHGLARAGEATVFPQAIGMAATWDKELLHAEGHVIAMEARARYNQAQREGNAERYFGLTLWAPNINIFRDPRWGRGQETLGEDPYLTGILATQFVKGMQGDDPDHPLAIATPKHFAVHSGPEPLRHQFNVDVAPRDLAETYLPAFRRSIIDGKAQSIMCAYNAVDGVPACGSEMLLKDVLRSAWGFKGFVTSDCGAIDDFVTGHKTESDHATASAVSIRTGTDIGCNFRNEYLAIPDAVQRKLISEAEVDRALTRLMEARIRLGMLEPVGGGRYADIPYSENHSVRNRDIALRAARESIVLLKNDGVLPLAGASGKILVVGPAAASREALNGNYKGTAVDQMLPIDGISAALGAQSVTFRQGSPFVDGFPLTVPRTVFGPAGVQARFWNGVSFAGPVVATRTEREIDNDWNGLVPAAGVDRSAFSAEYSGTITVPAGGEYIFEIGDRRCDYSKDQQTYVLSIEGEPDVRGKGQCGSGIPLATKPIKMEPGHPRKFRLAFTHQSPLLGAGLTLMWRPPAEALQQEALVEAKNADVIVAMVGLTAGLEGEEMKVDAPNFSGGDRTTVELPDTQRKMLEQLLATGKPVIVVGVSGSAIALGDAGRGAKAVLQAWYGGEAAGRAIGEVLAGQVNPSGRLPITFYESTSQLPAFEDYSMKGRTYRYFTGVPEFPFGHGLSYTQFAYANIAAPPKIRAGLPAKVTASIRNMGKVAGEEVAQLYIVPIDRPDLPRTSLKGFERIHLSPGETGQVSFSLEPRDLAFADEKGAMRIQAGKYRVWVGGGQQDTGAPGLATTIEISGNLLMPK